MTNSRVYRERGFVLVLVLTLLVILALLATAAATSTERAIRTSLANADAFNSELDMTSTRETLLYMLATQRKTVAGLTVNESDARPHPSNDEDIDGLNAYPVGNEIRLDGTTYRGMGRTLFALQDDRGLINPNWAPSSVRFALYESLGASDSQWDGLDAKRLDYQDPDSLHRLHGAEERHYRRAGLPAPSNRPLTTPLEYRRILGWDEMLKGLDDLEVLSILTTTRGVDLNINTAPLGVLRLIPGVSPEAATRITKIRASAPMLSVWHAQQTFGVSPIMEEAITLFAKPSGNLILWDEKSGARRLLHWTLTPSDAGGHPWRIDYEVILPRGNELNQAVVGTPATPLFPTQIPPGGIQ